MIRRWILWRSWWGARRWRGRLSWRRSSSANRSSRPTRPCFPRTATVVLARFRRHVGDLDQVAARQAMDEAAADAREEMSDPAEQVRAEQFHVVGLDALHHVERIRMAAGRALAEDHQRARHDVRAFHRSEER